MPVKSGADPTLCPLCGQANQCAMELERVSGVPQPPCWCTRVGFDAALLARLPEPARGQACICAACAGSPDGDQAETPDACSPQSPDEPAGPGSTSAAR